MQLFLVEQTSLKQVLDFNKVRLRDLLLLSNDAVLSILVSLNLIKNSMICEKCGTQMRIINRSILQDGIYWVCKSKGVNCSTKSLRSGSFFGKSNLSLSTALLLCYMFASDYDNKHLCHELSLNKNTVCDWLNLCRDICWNQCNNSKSIGGPNEIIEIDETCFSKRKYNRGRKMPGNAQWIFGGVQRGKEGKAFAFRVPDRKKKTLLKIIRRRIKPGTTIISDEWPAYRKLGKQMGKPVGYKHFMICHKRTFARSAFDENNNRLRIHTNKIEGFWSHLKHKIKRLRGTSDALKSSYVAEAVFRQNCKVDQRNILEAFFERVSMVFRIDNYIM